jgi:hypothetical protein
MSKKEKEKSRWDNIPPGMMLSVPPFSALQKGAQPVLVPRPMSKKERKAREKGND